MASRRLKSTGSEFGNHFFSKLVKILKKNFWSNSDPVDFKPSTAVDFGLKFAFTPKNIHVIIWDQEDWLKRSMKCKTST